jgi:thiosulfate dehydrogenase [quinone] large subunit
MITMHRTSRTSRQADSATNHTTTEPVVLTETTRRVLAVLRIGFGLTFLWAFFDKPVGLLRQAACAWVRDRP